MPAKVDVLQPPSSKLVLNCALAVAMVVLVLAAYVPVMDAKFIWDDDWLVVKNENLHDLGGLIRLWTPDWWGKKDIPDYYPATWTSFWIERQMWGLNPAGYHVVNILLHAASALVLWRVLAAMGWRWGWFAAAIFAVHPVNVASVAWVAERKNTLSMLFYLLSILMFVRFLQGRRGKHYALSLAMFLLAMLSKTSVAMLPVVLLLVIYLRRDRVAWRDLLATAPFFVGLSKPSTQAVKISAPALSV